MWKFTPLSSQYVRKQLTPFNLHNRRIPTSHLVNSTKTNVIKNFHFKNDSRQNYGQTKKENTANPLSLAIYPAIVLGGGALWLMSGNTDIYAEENKISTLEKKLEEPKPTEQESKSDNVITSSDESKPKKEEDSTRFWLNLLLSEAGLFALSILAALGSSLITVQLPSMIGQIIDLAKSTTSNKTSSMRTILYTLFTSSTTLHCFGLLTGQALLQFVYASLLSVATERIVAKLRSRVFAALLEKDISVFDQLSSGELMSALSGDVQEVRLAIRHAVSMGVRSTTQIVGGAVTLFLISKKLTSLMLVILPAMILTGTVYGRFLQRLSKKVQQSIAKSSAVAQEAISNIRTVRAFANEEQMEKRYSKEIQESYKLSKKMGVLIGTFQGLSTMALYGSVMFVLLYGGTLVNSGELTSGSLTSYMLYTINLQGSMTNLSILQGELLKGMGAANRIHKIISAKAVIPTKGGNILSNVKGTIEFQNVHFSYPSRPHVQVFNDLSFKLDEGKVYALVGPSGSGKSTIASLIERFYDPSRGQVLMDGVNIASLDPSWLRRNIAIVSQEPVLFATSIADNISFGKSEATKEEIELAARLANAHDFISHFPNGYETMVGERGVQLSGGQKQRIAIARAILKNAKILILDEATSALDTESEHLVQEALQRLMKGRTVILIAHRLSTVQNSDVIFVVKGGKIVETGSHDSLIKQNGVYATLVSKQLMQ